MDLQIQGKVVLITGGAKGIGAAIVRGCVDEEAVPVIVDRDVDAGRQLQSQMAGSGKKVGFIPADLATAQDCLLAVEQTVREFGRLDALVNNAGINDRVGLEHGSPEKFVGSLERNLLHYYNMAHYGVPALKKSRGCVVNIASKTAVTGQGGTSGYVAAKGAILGLTREWAAELGPSGIRVNAIVPAEVMTPLYRQWLDTFPNAGEKLKSIVAKIPFDHRMTTAEEIANMAAFLISGRASHITGQHLFVDGGYVHLDR